MLEIGVVEAQNILGALLDRVEHGEEVLITRDGKPIAKLVADATNPPRLEHPVHSYAESMAAAERIRKRAALLPKEPFDWEMVKADLGRK